MDDIEEVNIKRFRMDEIELNSKIAIIGKPGTGKTSIIKDILYRHRSRFTKGILMSGTTASSKDFEGVFPDIFIYNIYKQDVADKFWKKQKNYVVNVINEHIGKLIVFVDINIQMKILMYIVIQDIENVEFVKE